MCNSGVAKIILSFNCNDGLNHDPGISRVGCARCCLASARAKVPWPCGNAALSSFALQVVNSEGGSGSNCPSNSVAKLGLNFWYFLDTENPPVLNPGPRATKSINCFPWPAEDHQGFECNGWRVYRLVHAS